MAMIEAQLKRLQDTEDLSYSSRGLPAESSSDQIPSTPSSQSRLDSKGRQLIDETTLARLLDECKQEQEQLQMIEIA